MKRWLLTFLAVILLIPNLAVAADKSPKPVVGGTLAFAIGQWPDTLAYPFSLSAYTAEVTEQIFGAGLLRVGPDGKVEPAMAKAMPAISKDNRTYTFQLRRDMHFHDGTEVTAWDFSFTYSLFRNKDYTGYKPYGTDFIKSVDVLGRYTLAVTLTQPVASFMGGSILFEPPLPKHLLSRVSVKQLPQADFWRNPTGAGPFRFVEWRREQFIHLERNPDYWEAKVNPAVGPWLQDMIIVAGSESGDVQAFAEGMLSFLEVEPHQELEAWQKEHKEVLALHQWRRVGYGQTQFNHRRFPTNVPEVRRALAHALDRNAIMKARFGDYAAPLAGIIPKGHAMHNPALPPIEYDLAKAEALLRTVGFTKGKDGMYQKDGKLLTIDLAATENLGMAAHIVEVWRKAGIDAHYRGVPFDTLVDDVLPNGKFHASFSGIGFSIDPAVSMGAYHSREIRLDAQGRNSGTNRAGYSNPEVDKLLDQGDRIQDPKERTAIYQKVEQLLQADTAVIPMYQNVYFGLVWHSYKGVVVMDGYGFGFYERWYVDDEKSQKEPKP